MNNWHTIKPAITIHLLELRISQVVTFSIHIIIIIWVYIFFIFLVHGIIASVVQIIKILIAVGLQGYLIIAVWCILYV